MLYLPFSDLPLKKCPMDFNLDWKFQSWPSEFPTKNRVCWVARLKFSISIENFNPGGRSWIFSIFGPLRRFPRFRFRVRFLAKRLRFPVPVRFLGHPVQKQTAPIPIIIQPPSGTPSQPWVSWSTVKKGLEILHPLNLGGESPLLQRK